MLAIEIPRFGGPEVLRRIEVPVPSPGPGEVRVAVRAAGVNFADVLCRLGVYAAAPRPPFVPGIEVAGTVEAVGPGVAEPLPGERVFGFCRFGGYAESAILRAEHALPIPDGMSFADAAAFPVQYLTAWYGLDLLARVAPGERVLVRSAAGGVGTAALELLRARGARVLATAGSEAKLARIRSSFPEADAIPDEASALRAALETPLDVAFDAAGGDLFRIAWNALAPGGRYVLYGAASAVGRGRLSKLAAAWRLRRMLLVAPLGMIGANRSLHAFNLIFLTGRTDLLRTGCAELLRLRASLAIAPHAEMRWPLAEAAAAHREMQERRTVGKVVLDVPR